MQRPLEAGTSRSVDDFLKKVYALQQATERVSTNQLAEALQISAASVTDMAQRLHEAQLIDHRKYYGVRLTESGESIALRVLRRHRIIELFLVQELGYAMHEIHEEAERLEHAVSDRFIESLAAILGQPLLDPHGDPIPSAAGEIHDMDLQRLSDLPLAQPATVRGLSSTDPSELALQNRLGFNIGALVIPIHHHPESGEIIVEVGGKECQVGEDMAATILVEIRSKKRL